MFIPNRNYTLAVLALCISLTITGCNDTNNADNKLNPPDNTEVDKEREVRDKPASLQSKLDSMKNMFESRAPEETKTAYAQGIQEVGSSGVMETALKEGDKAYMFELPSANGNKVILSKLLKDGPVVVIWYRGGWCPYCNLQLSEMQSYLPQIDSLGASLVAISPEVPDSTLSTQEKNELDYYVLSDNGNNVARKYGIVYTLPGVVQEKFDGRIDIDMYNGDKNKELPLAVTYVINTDGTITYAFIDDDYKKRAEPQSIIDELKKLRQG